MKHIFLITIFIFFISIDLYSWDHFCNKIKICDNKISISLNVDSFQKWKKDIEPIFFSAVNYLKSSGGDFDIEYSGKGDRNPEIYYDPLHIFSRRKAEVLFLTTRGWCGGCILSGTVSFEINSKYWKDKDNPQKLRNTVAHELGHLLGLDHTEHSFKNYRAILMQNSTTYSTHLTEDDKHGILDLYPPKKKAVKISKYPFNNFQKLPISTIYPVDGIYQNNKNYGYDYIFIHSLPKSKKIGYYYGIKNGEKIALLDDKIREISNSYTLASPSIAINNKGNTIVAVWRSEFPNFSSKFADRIQIGYIPSSKKIPPKDGITLYGNGKKSEFYRSQTVADPIVVWSDSFGGRFIIFYPLKLGGSSWKISYIISDKNFNFINSKIYTLPYKTDWNRVGVLCENLKNRCLLIYNESSKIGKFSNINFQILKISKRGKLYPESSKKLKFSKKFKSFMANRKNFAHMKLISIGKDRLFLTFFPLFKKVGYLTFNYKFNKNSIDFDLLDYKEDKTDHLHLPIIYDKKGDNIKGIFY